MARPFTPKIVTGTDLLEGDVIYQTKTGWSPDFDQAHVLTDAAEAEARLAQAHARADLIIGPYLADVVVQDGTHAPAHFREAFRRTGPSNYRHGKQVELS